MAARKARKKAGFREAAPDFYATDPVDPLLANSDLAANALAVNLKAPPTSPGYSPTPQASETGSSLGNLDSIRDSLVQRLQEEIKMAKNAPLSNPSTMVPLKPMSEPKQSRETTHPVLHQLTDAMSNPSRPASQSQTGVPMDLLAKLIQANSAQMSKPPVASNAAADPAGHQILVQLFQLQQVEKQVPQSPDADTSSHQQLLTKILQMRGQGPTPAMQQQQPLPPPAPAPTIDNSSQMKHLLTQLLLGQMQSQGATPPMQQHPQGPGDNSLAMKQLLAQLLQGQTQSGASTPTVQQHVPPPPQASVRTSSNDHSMALLAQLLTGQVQRSHNTAVAAAPMQGVHSQHTAATPIEQQLRQADSSNNLGALLAMVVAQSQNKS